MIEFTSISKRYFLRINIKQECSCITTVCVATFVTKQLKIKLIPIDYQI